MAQNVVNVGEKHTVTPESHLFATFVKSLPYDLKLTIEEEIRSAPSHRAHTTLGLGYTPIPYLNIYAGYTVMIYGKNAGWDDPNNYIRHRVNVLLTPQIKLGQWSLSLREGLMIDTRTDDIDTRVKSASTLTLRSRLQAVYAIGTTPLSVVAKIEMLNTLNAPVDYLNSIVPETDKYSSCYISELRPEAGLQWKINKQHALTLTYRYNYLYSRDASILDSGDVDLTNSYTTKHLILLAYKLDW
jgi:hypothetical protein